MAVILPLARWLLPESRGGQDGPWDVLGALMAAAGVLGVVLGVKRLAAARASWIRSRWYRWPSAWRS